MVIKDSLLRFAEAILLWISGRFKNVLGGFAGIIAKNAGIVLISPINGSIIITKLYCITITILRRLTSEGKLRGVSGDPFSCLYPVGM